MLRFGLARIVSVSPAFVLAATIAACGGSTEPLQVRQRSVVSAVWSAGAAAESRSGPVPSIAAPETVTAGSPFLATITTIGLNGCWTAAGTDIDRGSAVVVVRPYDEAPGDQICPDVIVELSRTVELTFSQAGEAVIRVEGYRMVDGVIQEGILVSLEKRIVVR